MESRIIEGLYFAGEVMDVDALTGGFNLQIAWSTGYQAGISAAEETPSYRRSRKGRKGMSYSIAIDGPAGAGKSTIARRIAKEMKFVYVDAGAMYRAMALYFIKNGIRPEDGEKISEKCRNADITICHVDGEQVVLLDGENVNERIRTEEVGNMASVSSVNPEVRKKLVERSSAWQDAWMWSWTGAISAPACCRMRM